MMHVAHGVMSKMRVPVHFITFIHGNRPWAGWLVCRDALRNESSTAEECAHCFAREVKVPPAGNTVKPVAPLSAPPCTSDFSATGTAAPTNRVSPGLTLLLTADPQQGQTRREPLLRIRCGTVFTQSALWITNTFAISAIFGL